MKDNPLAKKIFLFLFFFLFSCSSPKETSSEGKGYEIEKEYTRGPIHFTLKVSHKEITIAQSIQLVIEARISEEYDVEMPQLGEKLQEFFIKGYESNPPRLLPDNVVLWHKSYKLEPFLSGEYKIPGIKLFFWKKNKAEQKHEVESEECTIKVTSLIPEKSGPLNIRESTAPLEIENPTPWLLPVAAGWIALSFVIFGVILWYKKDIRKSVPVILAHEFAFDQIERLIEENYIERGMFKHFYQGISEILRTYIENRFSLRAPERTTEEFLQELRENDVLEDAYKKILKEFLEHCDLVKFAAYQPQNEEIQKTFDTCKNFIQTTKKNS